MQITPLLTTPKSTTNPTQTNVAGDYNKFLTLLTAQLQNQDPLAPMDASQFTNQLVQFSQVEQSVHMNENIKDMLKLQEQSQLQSAVSFVGRTVDVLGQEFSVTDAQPTDILYAVDGTPAAASIQVFNGTGQLVRTLSAPEGAGPNHVTWDGKDALGNKVADGIYRLQVTALDRDGKSLSVQSGFSGKVRQVENIDGVMMLSIGGKKIPLSDIVSVRSASLLDP